MKTIYLMMGLGLMMELSGCARPILESNYQKTQPLLTQMLCPTCDVPSLNPVVAKAPPAPQPVESTTISTVDNPPPASETTASTDAQPAPADNAPQTPSTAPTPAPVASPAAPSKRVITLDLNAPDLGISSQSAPSPSAPVPPQSHNELYKKIPSSHIQLSEADIHNAQDVHELTVRLMHLNQ